MPPVGRVEAPVAGAILAASSMAVADEGGGREESPALLALNALGHLAVVQRGHVEARRTAEALMVHGDDLLLAGQSGKVDVGGHCGRAGAEQCTAQAVGVRLGDQPAAGHDDGNVMETLQHLHLLG